MIDNEFYISQKDWDKIQDYAKTAYDTEESEIGGMLVAIKDKDNDWELKDPVILKQIISASNCVLDKDALALYYTKAGTKYKKNEFRFVWWHSHHTMKAFWSATDLKAIEEYNDGDFSFSLVVNLRQEYKFRVSLWKPFEMHEDVELTIINSKVNKVPKKIIDEVAKLCTKPTYTASTYKWGKKWKVEKPQSMIGMNDGAGSSIYDPEQLSLISNPADAEYRYAYNSIDNLNKKYADGTIQYELYIKKAEEINEALNNIYDGRYEIEILPKEVLDTTIMFNSPAEYIAMNIDSIYEDEDYKSWNASFKMGRVY